MLLDIVKKGSTDRSVILRIIDSADGTPETGVLFNTSGIDLWYRREGAAKTSITEATLSALTDAHSDGGFLHVGDGYYRLDLPDAAFATAAQYVDIGGTVTGMVVIGGRVRLVDIDIEVSAIPANVTQFGGTNLTATGGRPEVNATHLNGGALSGNNADIALKSISVVNSAGSAIVATSTGSNGIGIWATGHGTGAGIRGSGASGGSGVGIVGIGGGGGGVGVQATGQAAEGFYISSNNAGSSALKAVPGSGGIPIEGNITGNITGNLSGSVGSVASGGIAAASFAAGAIDAAAIAADAIGASELAAGAASEIATAVRTELATELGRVDAAVTTRASQASLDTVDDFLDTEVAAIKAKTDGLPSDPADASDVAAAFSTVNSTLGTIAGYVDTEVAAIKAITDALMTRTNTAQAGAAGTITLDASASAVDDFYNYQVIQIVSGTGAGQARIVSDYVGSTKVASVNGNWATNPDNTSVFALRAFGAIPGATAPTAADIRAEIDANSTKLDVAVSTRASQTSVDDIPTNAELTTALAAADDAVLAAIAALNNLSQANIRTAIGLGSANLDTQLDALPTNGELSTALGTADDAVLAAIAALNNLSIANVRTAVGLASANLDTQLAAIDDAVDTEIASIISTLSTIAGYLDTEVAAIKAKTDLIPAAPAAVGDIPTAVQNADALLKRDMSAVTGEAARSMLNALRFLRNRWAISAGTLTVFKEDDSTSAWTGAATQTAGDPVSQVDPA